MLEGIYGFPVLAGAQQQPVAVLSAYLPPVRPY